jgi:hypothetical protein
MEISITSRYFRYIGLSSFAAILRVSQLLAKSVALNRRRQRAVAKDAIQFSGTAAAAKRLKFGRNRAQITLSEDPRR